MRKIRLLAIALLGSVFVTFTPLFGGHADRVELEVWAVDAHAHDYCSQDFIDFYIRPYESSYLTVVLIEPDGYANVIYPTTGHTMRRLRAGRVYRLSEVLGYPLRLYPTDGSGFISIIASRRPVWLADWALQELRAYCASPIPFRFGVMRSDRGLWVDFGISWTKHLHYLGYGAWTREIPLTTRHRHPHPRYRPVSRYAWRKQWAYRSAAPVIAPPVYKSGNRRAITANRQRMRRRVAPPEDLRSNRADASRRKVVRKARSRRDISTYHNSQKPRARISERSEVTRARKSEAKTKRRIKKSRTDEQSRRK